jgi:hypothetical protein
MKHLALRAPGSAPLAHNAVRLCKVRREIRGGSVPRIAQRPLQLGSTDRFRSRQHLGPDHLPSGNGGLDRASGRARDASYPGPRTDPCFAFWFRSLEVKAPGGRAYRSDPYRGASNLAGRSKCGHAVGLSSKCLAHQHCGEAIPRNRSFCPARPGRTCRVRTHGCCTLVEFAGSWPCAFSGAHVCVR